MYRHYIRFTHKQKYLLVQKKTMLENKVDKYKKKYLALKSQY
jgi:hypothetical protein